MARQDLNRAMRNELSDRLKEEAGLSRADFSPALHDRIMRSVASCELAERAPRPKTTGAMWLFATAAVLLVAVGATLVLRTDPRSPDVAGVGAGTDNVGSIRSPAATQVPTQVPSQTPSQTPTAASGEIEAEPQDITGALYFVAVREMDEVRQSDVLMESMLAAEQVALLDHDARLAADWLLDPLTLALAVGE